MRISHVSVPAALRVNHDVHEEKQKKEVRLKAFVNFVLIETIGD